MNPLREIRERLGLTRLEFAQAAGIGYNQLYAAEKSMPRKPNARVLEFLASLGYDPEEVAERYTAYRNALGEELKRRLSA